MPLHLRYEKWSPAEKDKQMGSSNGRLHNHDSMSRLLLLCGLCSYVPMAKLQSCQQLNNAKWQQTHSSKDDLWWNNPKNIFYFLFVIGRCPTHHMLRFQSLSNMALDEKGAGRSPYCKQTPFQLRLQRLQSGMDI